MWTAEKVYELMRYYISDRIYYNKEYYPILMAMSYLIAETWNNADKLTSLVDAETIPKEYLGYLFEFLGYKKQRFKTHDITDRIFIQNFLNIMRHRGTEQSMISAIQFDVEINSDDYTKFYVPEVKIEAHPSGLPHEYMVYYPIENGFIDPLTKTTKGYTDPLFKYVKPAGQKDYFAPVGHENYNAYYFNKIGQLKYGADELLNFKVKRWMDDTYAKPTDAVKMMFHMRNNFEVVRDIVDAIGKFAPKYILGETVKAKTDSLGNIKVRFTEIRQFKGSEVYSFKSKYSLSETKAKPTDALSEKVSLIGYKEIYPRQITATEMSEEMSFDNAGNVIWVNRPRTVFKDRDSMVTKVRMDMGMEDYSTMTVEETDRFNVFRANTRVEGPMTVKRVRDEMTLLNV